MCVNRATKYVMLRHVHCMYGVVCMALHDYTQTHTPKGTCYGHHLNHQQHNAASTQQEYATLTLGTIYSSVFFVDKSLRIYSYGIDLKVK